jgi:hypothetical protein
MFSPPTPAPSRIRFVFASIRLSLARMYLRDLEAAPNGHPDFSQMVGSGGERLACSPAIWTAKIERICDEVAPLMPTEAAVILARLQSVQQSQ